jgi:hypothetical protein
LEADAVHAEWLGHSAPGGAERTQQRE